jgi:hypothetical protein
MDCPFGLIYNANADQCEEEINVESICQREQPCLNQGQCYQTSPSSFKCTCRGAWTGERCETPVSSCANNPCGEGNECQTLITSDYKQDYVCICDKGESYGSSCERSRFFSWILYQASNRVDRFSLFIDTVPNPCLAASIEQQQYYSFAFSSHAYVQCNGDLLHLQPCATGLYWNQDEKICDHEAVSPPTPSDTQQQSYQVSYNTDVPRSTYSRGPTSFVDEGTDRQQGYRYRNYSPHTKYSDQR